jgi:serine protease Do
MRTVIRRGAFVALTALAVLAGGYVAGTSTEAAPDLAGPVFRVDVALGHGSGVAIGNGLVLTAAHVVNDAATVKLKAENGREIEASVLWVNKTYDVALLRVADDVASADLNCRMPKRGQAIVAAGSPMHEDNLFIPGSIVGNERTTGPWKSVIVAALAGTQGISGGPAFDEDGEVVGIVVGMMALPLGLSVTQTGLMYIVPAPAICNLLGRA